LPSVSRSKKAILKHISVIARYTYFENYTAAERLLNEIKSKIRRRGLWGEGCFSAAKGLIVAGKEKNRVSLFWKVKNANLRELSRIKKSLIKDLTRENVDEFEEGFLEAWITIIDAFSNVLRQQRRSAK